MASSRRIGGRLFQVALNRASPFRDGEDAESGGVSCLNPSSVELLREHPGEWHGAQNEICRLTFSGWLRNDT